MENRTQILLVFLALSAASASGLAAQDDARQRALRNLERPTDAPGIPALPDPWSAPAEPVTLGGFTSVQVNVDALGANIPGDAANEPSIAVDPTDPSRIVIGWRQFDTVTSSFRQAGWAYSADAGASWSFPGVIDPGNFRSDPVLDSDASGNFYYNSLSGNFTTQVFRSTDGGMTWGPGVQAFGGDKQWFVIDKSGGVGNGNIYCAWSVFAGCCGNDTFTRSIDGGASYQTPISIPSSPIFGTLALGPGGVLYVGGVNPNDFDDFLVAKSSNAPIAALPATFDFTSSVVLGGSIQFGLGFTSPSPDGLLGQVIVAADASNGPFGGNVYLLSSVDPPGSDPMDIRFSRSVDGGQTWSASVRVNDDPVGNARYQWFGTMSVAPNGRIDVVWNDTRRTDGVNFSELFYAFSSDGGLSWSANRPLSPPFDSHAGLPNGSQKLGDYYDMISDNRGAHLAWAATFNGEQDVYYLRIPFTKKSVAPGPDSLADGGTVGPPQAAPGANPRIRLEGPTRVGTELLVHVDVPDGSRADWSYLAVIGGSLRPPLFESAAPVLGRTATHVLRLPNDPSWVGRRLALRGVLDGTGRGASSTLELVLAPAPESCYWPR